MEKSSFFSVMVRILAVFLSLITYAWVSAQLMVWYQRKTVLMAHGFEWYWFGSNGAKCVILVLVA